MVRSQDGLGASKCAFSKAGENNYMLKQFLIASMIIMVYGCATAPPIPTPSGKAEAVLPNVTKKEVANEIINSITSNGYNLKDSSEYLLVFDKPIDSPLAAMLYGSKFNATPNSRVHCQLTDGPGGVRVLLSLFIVTNPGTAFEQITDVSKGKDAYEAYKALESVKARLSSR